MNNEKSEFVLHFSCANAPMMVTKHAMYASALVSARLLTRLD